MNPVTSQSTSFLFSLEQDSSWTMWTTRPECSVLCGCLQGPHTAARTHDPLSDGDPAGGVNGLLDLVKAKSDGILQTCAFYRWHHSGDLIQKLTSSWPSADEALQPARIRTSEPETWIRPKLGSLRQMKEFKCLEGRGGMRYRGAGGPREGRSFILKSLSH